MYVGICANCAWMWKLEDMPGCHSLGTINFYILRSFLFSLDNKPQGPTYFCFLWAVVSNMLQDNWLLLLNVGSNQETRSSCLRDKWFTDLATTPELHYSNARSLVFLFC